MLLVRSVSSGITARAREEQKMSSENKKDQKSEPPGPDDKYKVGNKKPPKETRFALGKSGNPSGRPKGSLGLKQKFERELKKVVIVNVNGKPTKMTQEDIMVTTFVRNSMKGDVKTANLLFRVTGHDAAENAASAANEEFAPPDKEALQRVATRMLRLSKEAR